MNLEEFPGSLARMGLFGIMKESARLMHRNFWLFSNFAASFTIPYAVFTVLLVSAIDITRDYTVAEFFDQEQTEIFGLRITLLSAEARYFLFLVLTIVPLGLMHTVLCTRGVLNVYANKDLASSIQNSYDGLPGGLQRALATKCWLVLYWLMQWFRVSAWNASYERPDTFVEFQLRAILWSLKIPLDIILLIYPIHAQQVAILEPANYGLTGVIWAMILVTGKGLISSGLFVATLVYFPLLKLLVDVSLREPYPVWTKFVAYPSLVIFVTTMSVYWQVVYTVFYLACKAHREGATRLVTPAAVKEDQMAAA